MGFLLAGILSVRLIMPASALESHGAPYKLDLNLVLSSGSTKSAHAFQILTFLSMHGVLVTAEMPDYLERRFTFQLSGKTVREALDEFVRQAPGYEWEEIENRLVRIRPKSRASTPLDTLDVKSLEFHSKGQTVTGTILRLSNFLRDKGYPVVGGGKRDDRSWDESTAYEREDAVISIQATSKESVRDLLDQIVRLDAPAMWVATVSPDGRMAILAQATHQHTLDSPADKRLKNRPCNPKALPGCSRGGQ